MTIEVRTYKELGLIIVKEDSGAAAASVVGLELLSEIKEKIEAVLSQSSAYFLVSYAPMDDSLFSALNADLEKLAHGKSGTIVDEELKSEEDLIRWLKASPRRELKSLGEILHTQADLENLKQSQADVLDRLTVKISELQGREVKVEDAKAGRVILERFLSRKKELEWSSNRASNNLKILRELKKKLAFKKGDTASLKSSEKKLRAYLKGAGVKLSK